MTRPTRIAGSFRIAGDHPCLDGHFPGRPLVPGVVLLDEVLAIIDPLLAPGHRAAGFDAVKFHAPVLPGSEVTVQGEFTGIAATFTAAVGDRPVLSGVARFAAPG